MQTIEIVERWECDMTEYDPRFGKALDEDVEIAVMVALAAPAAQNYSQLKLHILKSFAQVRTLPFDN